MERRFRRRSSPIHEAIIMAQDKEFTYDTTPPVPKRTVDRPFTEEHARALTALRALVNTNEAGEAIDGPMGAPHLGDRMSQRQVARRLLAGRSYQAVQAWLAGEPTPASMVDFLTQDLQRIDALAKDRMVRVAKDEIAIVVKR